eukprot:11649_1
MYGALFSLNPINHKSHILDLNIEWYPIDSDIISLELQKLLSGIIISLQYIARALTTLQQVFGRFPIIRSAGDFSCSIVDIIYRLMSEDDSTTGDIAQCIDRTIDMITPCLTPRTYELNIVLNSSDLIYKQIRDTPFKYLGKLLSTMA